MQIFKFLILFFGLTGFAMDADAQFLNADFANGPASWQWMKSDGLQSCGTLQAFTPSTNNETPFLNNIYSGFSSRFGRIANISGENTFFSDRGASCKELSQEVNLSQGQELQFEMWTNAGSTSSSCIGCRYASASIKVYVRDTQSSLSAVYDPGVISGPMCDSNTCRDFTKYGVPSLSAFWGKRVKISIGIATTFQRGTAGGGHLYPANIFIDNMKLEAKPILDLKPRTGAWYNSYRSGHGLHLSKSPDGRYQVMWYTYLSSGKPTWYISELAPVINGVLNAKIGKSIWNYSTQSNTVTPIGDIKFEMHDTGQFTFLWDLYSINGDNIGFDGGEQMSFLVGGDSYTGLWFEPAYSGYGYSIDYRNSSPFTSVTVFYYINGEPVWARNDKALTPTAGNIFEMTAYKGLGLCPECNGQTITLTATAVGEVGLSLDQNKSWVLLQDPATAATVWQRGLPAQPFDTARLTFP